MSLQCILNRSSVSSVSKYPHTHTLLHVSNAENPAYIAKSDEPADSPRNSYELLFKAQPSLSTKGGKVAKHESDALLRHFKHSLNVT